MEVVSIEKAESLGYGTIMPAIYTMAYCVPAFLSLCFLGSKARAVHKPNPVSGSGFPSPGNDHSSVDAGCPTPLATYPGAWAGYPLSPPYLVLHQVGFAKLPRSLEELVRSYRTFSPLPDTQLSS